MSNIFWTADPHYKHRNILKEDYANRPFANVEEMDNALIVNHNGVVSRDDTIYIVGDFIFGGAKQAEDYFARLNGRIKVVPGGHDKNNIYKRTYYSKSGHEVEILPLIHRVWLAGEHPDQLYVVLCHYPMSSWNRSRYGALHFYGHSHCNMRHRKNRLDVGVDCWDYKPVGLMEISKRMEERNNLLEEYEE